MPATNISELRWTKKIVQTHERHGDYDRVNIVIKDNNNEALEKIFLGKFNIRRINGCAEKRQKVEDTINSLEEKYGLKRCVAIWAKSHYDRWSEIHKACYVEIKNLPMYITEPTMREYEVEESFLNNFYRRINDTTYKKL